SPAAKERTQASALSEVCQPAPSSPSAQPSPEVASQLSSRCSPIASTVISTSARPMERHRIERIGGDNISESALAAASIIVGYLLKLPPRGRQPRPARQGPKTRPDDTVFMKRRQLSQLRYAGANAALQRLYFSRSRREPNVAPDAKETRMN